jgi:hypothetical protein
MVNPTPHVAPSRSELLVTQVPEGWLPMHASELCRHGPFTVCTLRDVQILA